MKTQGTSELTKVIIPMAINVTKERNTGEDNVFSFKRNSKFTNRLYGQSITQNSYQLTLPYEMCSRCF